MKTKALIYCRVSSQRQVVEGHGIESQEQRCKVYAQNKNYDVVEVFPDEGISGGLFERPAMQNLIAYMDKHPLEKFTIIFDDLARFARDVKVHIQLKAELQSRGATLECLNFNYDDSDESEMAELMLAVSNQYQRKSNRRQVIQKMKARLEKGYWPFCMPLGLINKKDPIHGKILTPREPYSTIYKEGVEKFRDGIIPTIEAFQTFCNEKYIEHGVSHRMSHETARRTLKDILYAGYIEYPKWNVPRMQAKHKGFLSIETYNAVQDLLEGRAKPHRKDYSLDFPLRPLVSCDTCGIPMTGSFHTSWNKKKYPHYFCRNRKCKFGNKNIAKDTFETQFKELLAQVKPAGELVDLAKEVLLEVWNSRLEMSSLQKKNAESEFERVKKEIDDYVERAGKAKDETLVAVYEEKIKTLVKRKKEIEQQLPQNPYSEKNFGTALEKVFGVIKKPVEMWQSDDYNDKRTILLMYFEDKLRYNHSSGFGTTALAYPIELITKKPPVTGAIVEMSSSELESKTYFKKHLQA